MVVRAQVLLAVREVREVGGVQRAYDRVWNPCLCTDLTKPLRLSDAELRGHLEWRDFGREKDRHPPMRGWLVAPLIGADGENYGLIQASDRIEGDFTEQDEVNFVRLALLASTALDALAQVHLADYRAKLAKSNL